MPMPELTPSISAGTSTTQINPTATRVHSSLMLVLLVIVISRAVNTLS